MTSYQIMVEGVFTRAPQLGLLVAGLGGFHTTFFVMSISANNAAHKVSELLATRMAAHSVVGHDSGCFVAYYWIHDIWEVTSEKYEEYEGHDAGFTFFLIGPMERFFLAARRLYFKKCRPWLLVQPRILAE